MTHRILYSAIIYTAISLFPKFGFSQENCTQKLRNARNFYQEGKLSELPELLSACVKNGFTKEEKIEALRLISLAHLYSEDEEKAEVSYLNLLEINPEFKPNINSDPVELILLAEKFDTDPKFFWGINIGAAYSLVEVKRPTRAIITNLGPGSYSFSTTIGGGLFFKQPINEIMSANAELYYMQRTLTLNKTSTAGSEQEITQIITEQHNWIELPLLFNYQLTDRPFLLELTAGPAFHYLLSADLNTSGNGVDPLNNIDKIDRRNVFNMSGLLGLRANIKSSGRLFFTLSALYQHRFLQEVVYDSDYTEEETNAIYDSQYEDGQFKGHSIWLKLGVKIPYYKPQLK